MGGGRIIFYDFGMMDELSMPLKRGLVNLIFGIYGNDVKEVVDSLEEMDVIRKVMVKFNHNNCLYVYRSL